MQLKKSLTAAIILSIIGIIAWESYWRSEGYYPTLSDEKALWAKERAKVEKASKNDVEGWSTINIDAEVKLSYILKVLSNCISGNFSIHVSFNACPYVDT